LFNIYLVIFCPIFCLIVDVVVEVIICRCFHAAGLLRSIFFGFFTGLFALLIYDFYIFISRMYGFGDFFAIVVIHLVTYFSLAYCYFNFLNLGETSIRIRLLRELKDAPDGLTLEEILTRYNREDFFERRILRLLKSGQIIEEDNKYRLRKPNMLIIAKILVFLKFICFGNKGRQKW
jgi:hypothetical protein